MPNWNHVALYVAQRLGWSWTFLVVARASVFVHDAVHGINYGSKFQRCRCSTLPSPPESKVDQWRPHKRKQTKNRMPLTINIASRGRAHDMNRQSICLPYFQNKFHLPSSTSCSNSFTQWWHIRVCMKMCREAGDVQRSSCSRSKSRRRMPRGAGPSQKKRSRMPAKA